MITLYVESILQDICITALVQGYNQPTKYSNLRRDYVNNYIWLVGCFVFNVPLRQPREREKEKRKDRGEIKISKQPPLAPTASTIGPCHTIIQTVGRPGTGSLPRTIATPDHSCKLH